MDIVERPAWYSVKGRGALTDIFNLLHPPYTLWNLSYVLIGIALSPTIFLGRSIAVIVAFFLGLGIGAHALDETMGNPLQTRLSKKELYALGFSSLAVAVAIGMYYVFTLSILILPLIVVEVFFALVYNLEAFNKKFHNTLVFAVSWGVIPFMTGYFVNSLSLGFETILVSFAVALLTYVQRTLSLHARSIRRNAYSQSQSLKLTSGVEVPITSKELISPAEKSLKALTVMILVLAIALIVQRLLV